MAIHDFHDRRERESIPKMAIRSRAALEEHIAREHGARVPEQPDTNAGYAWVKWHHDVMHNDEWHVPNTPHEH